MAHDPQATADGIRCHLRHRFGVRQLGTIITDSTCTPLRRGTTGICLAHSGFAATRDYAGEPDLFGRRFRVSQANIAGGLAAAAVVTMGEGAERTPVCVIEDVPFVQFQDHDPTAEEIDLGRIPLAEDLFAPFLAAVDWTVGRHWPEPGRIDATDRLARDTGPGVAQIGAGRAVVAHAVVQPGGPSTG